MDIAVAEEEITRWKVAAQQEADAGKAIEHDFVAQVYNGNGYRTSLYKENFSIFVVVLHF